jgi:hypothetical protein
LLFETLELIPSAAYGIIIGMCLTIFAWLILRLLRPDIAALGSDELKEIQNLEDKFRVIMVAYQKKVHSG